MKHFVACLVALCCALTAGEQLTVFGNFGLTALRQYGLKVNTFELTDDLDAQSTLRVCEAIDNSEFVGFGPQLPSVRLNRVFASPEIAKTLRELLRRGGVIYFGPTNWNVCASLPASMRDFFKDIGAELAWHTSRYNDTSTSKREVQVEAHLAPELAGTPFASPHASVTEKAIRHFGSLAGTCLKPLLVSKDGGQVVAVYQSFPKGCIVFSYAFTPHRQTHSPFLENLLSMAYGKLRRLSARQRLSAAVPAAPLAPPPFFIDLNKTHELKLNDSKTGAAPRQATAVTLKCDRKILSIVFRANAKQPIKADINNRDGRVWTDDCVELFLSPGLRKSSTVYHFILNSKNVLYDEKDENSAWNMKGLTTSARLTDTGYIASFEIDMAELSLGESFRINLCREAYSPQELTTYHPAKGGFFSPNSFAVASFGQPFAPTAPPAAGTLRICERPLLERILDDSEPPVDEADTNSLKILTAPGDRESVKLVFYNRSGAHQYYRIEPQEEQIFKKADDGDDLGGCFSFKCLMPWRACNGLVFDEVAAPLGPAGILVVPDGANTSLMLTVDAQLPPGKYKWGFKLVPMTTDAPSRRIAVELEVLNLKYPAAMAHAYTFGPYYVFTPKRWDILLKNRIDYLQTGFPFKAITKGAGAPVLSEKTEDYLGRLDKIAPVCTGWVYSYGICPEFAGALKRNGGSDDWSDTATRQLFRDFVKRWVEALRSKGYGTDRFYVPLRDEPRSEHIDAMLFAADVLHQYGVRTCCTLAVWSTADDIRRLAPAIDLWIPFEPRIISYEHAADELAFYQSTGKPIRPYLCSTTGNSSDYLTYFRFRGIRSFLLGADGFCLWAANSWRGNPYHTVEDTKSYGSWLFHHGDGEPVGTLRLEAFREAVEDLAWLRFAAQSANPDAAPLIAPEALRKLMKDSSPQAVALWRNNLLRALAK